MTAEQPTQDPSALVRELRERIDAICEDRDGDLNLADFYTSIADLIEHLTARVAELESEREVEWGTLYEVGSGFDDEYEQWGSRQEAEQHVKESPTDHALVSRTVTVGPWKEVTDD